MTAFRGGGVMKFGSALQVKKLKRISDSDSTNDKNEGEEKT
jgi:hypothetical protein